MLRLHTVNNPTALTVNQVTRVAHMVNPDMEAATDQDNRMANLVMGNLVMGNPVMANPGMDNPGMDNPATVSFYNCICFIRKVFNARLKFYPFVSKKLQ